jgi:hypothetical protein
MDENNSTKELALQKQKHQTQKHYTLYLLGCRTQEGKLCQGVLRD